jgi:hypothetical protein
MDYSAEARDDSYVRPLTPHVYSWDGIERTWVNIEYAAHSLVWPIPRARDNFHEIWYNQLRPPQIALAPASEPYDPYEDYAGHEVDLPDGWAESNDRGD